MGKEVTAVAQTMLMEKPHSTKVRFYTAVPSRTIANR